MHRAIWKGIGWIANEVVVVRTDVGSTGIDAERKRPGRSWKGKGGELALAQDEAARSARRAWCKKVVPGNVAAVIEAVGPRRYIGRIVNVDLKILTVAEQETTERKLFLKTVPPNDIPLVVDARRYRES